MDGTFEHPGEMVRRVRQRCGLTQGQLAVRAGTSQAAVSRIERGVESPTVDRLSLLLSVMGETLVLASRPMEMWADPQDILAERAMTAGQRVEQGLQLAEFATELARAPTVSGADHEPGDG